MVMGLWNDFFCIKMDFSKKKQRFFCCWKYFLSERPKWRKSFFFVKDGYFHPNHHCFYQKIDHTLKVLQTEHLAKRFFFFIFYSLWKILWKFSLTKSRNWIPKYTCSCIATKVCEWHPVSLSQTEPRYYKRNT